MCVCVCLQVPWDLVRWGAMNNPLFIIIICLIKSYVYANCYGSHKRFDGYPWLLRQLRKKWILQYPSYLYACIQCLTHDCLFFWSQRAEIAFANLGGDNNNSGVLELPFFCNCSLSWLNVTCSRYCWHGKVLFWATPLLPECGTVDTVRSS